MNKISNILSILIIFSKQYTWVGWKVHRLTKILFWNVTKWGLFFNIDPFVVHILLPPCFSAWIPLMKEKKNSRYDIIIWTFQSIFIWYFLPYSIYQNITHNLVKYIIGVGREGRIFNEFCSPLFYVVFDSRFLFCQLLKQNMFLCITDNIQFLWCYVSKLFCGSFCNFLMFKIFYCWKLVLLFEQFVDLAIENLVKSDTYPQAQLMF